MPNSLAHSIVIIIVVVIITIITTIVVIIVRRVFCWLIHFVVRALFRTQHLHCSARSMLLCGHYHTCAAGSSDSSRRGELPILQEAPTLMWLLHVNDKKKA